MRIDDFEHWCNMEKNNAETGWELGCTNCWSRCVSSCRSQADLELVLQDLKSSLEIKHLGFPIESYLHKVWDTRISMHRAWNVNNHGLLLLNNELLEILTVAITAISEEICEGIYSTKFQPNMAVIAMISVDWEKVYQICHCLNNQYATVEKRQSKVQERQQRQQRQSTCSVWYSTAPPVLWWHSLVLHTKQSWKCE